MSAQVPLTGPTDGNALTYDLAALRGVLLPDGVVLNPDLTMVDADDGNQLDIGRMAFAAATFANMLAQLAALEALADAIPPESVDEPLRDSFAQAVQHVLAL